MILVKKFTRQNILNLLLKNALDSLPDSSKGLLEARTGNDESVEIYFIERSPEEKSKLSS